jgi:TolB-like protein/Tfp pilus assembly protein PilF
VALKVLPQTFAANPDRLTRFEREARFLASLNHPNVAAIHGLEESDGERFLVLELVPGDSLAQRLARGSLPIREALTICCEIAKAVEAAHEKGIIHRDLKPHNVMITPKGTVKVLDFGVAKAFGAPAFASESAEPSTVTEETREHAILGTTPYMSPEQASAKPLDKRADIWAFGCVLYEVLSGRKAFSGETAASTIAAIHGQDPDWERLPAETPARIRELLRRCLAKDLDGRLRDIGDARLEIEAALDEVAAPLAGAARPTPARGAGKAAQPPAETARPGPAGAAPMSLVAELKRRNVFRVGAAYGIVGWLLVEVASVFLPTFKAPEWVMQVFTFLVILGFPLALIFAWAFELTPEGIKRQREVAPAQSITRATGRKLDFAIIGLLTLAVVFLVIDNYVLEAEQDPAAQAVTRGRSIAVLPFANRSANEEDAFFVDGMHDDILIHLSKIRSLKVISRTSVMEYRDRTKDLKTIGQELGVATILEGGVQRAGDQIRVSVQLIDAETDAHLWADIYNRRLTATNIFAIQTDIATAIVDALRATLSMEEERLLDTVPTESMAALEAYFRGKQRMARRNSVALAEAVDEFNRAIELDPNFALAYVGLADSYILQNEYSGLPVEEMIANAQAAIDRAMALDERLAEAHTSLGAIDSEREEFEAAEVAYQRALELNPNYATAYLWYSHLVDALGRRDEALELIKKAAELDPRSPVILQNLGIGFDSVGRFDESLAWYRKTIDIDPGFPSVYMWMGLHYWCAKGRLDEAVRWLRKSASLDPGDPGNLAFLSQPLLDLGSLDRAKYWSERASELSSESFFSDLAMQLLHLYQGDLSAALEYGREAFESRSSWSLTFSSLEPVPFHEMRAARYLEARAAFERIAPELLNEDFPKVEGKNYRAAINLALISSKTGEQQRADWLLKSGLEYIQQIPRLGFNGYDVADVQIYALQGEKEKALSALRQAIDEGWRRYWWYYLKFDPILESLHDEPEYQAMIAEIEADMAAQLERVREMERRGELAAIPRDGAALH